MHYICTHSIKFLETRRPCLRYKIMIFWMVYGMFTEMYNISKIIKKYINFKLTSG